MAWWGAGIGGTIGLLFGGPIGAIIGAGLGSSLTKDQPKLGNSQQKQVGFLVATFSMLAKIAKADGVVSKDEIEFINRFIRQELNLDPKSRQVAIEIFDRAKLDDTSIYKYAEQISEIFMHDDAMRETIYRVLFMTALADGELHPAEKEILELLPAYLQLHDGAYEILEAELIGGGGGRSRQRSQSGQGYRQSQPSGFPAGLDRYYKVLEVDKNATDSEVKSAFRKKAQEYHPDKLASKGLPDGFLKFAKEQMQQFTEAHDAIMKSRKKNA